MLDYGLAAKIGEGGMGVVWKATDFTLGRDVAVKVLPSDFARDASRLARFEREAKLLAALNHSNIASVYSLHEDRGRRFLAMEYVEGDDLSVRIARGPMPIDEVLAIALQVADALEEAHEKGIVHRDLKPANVKVKADGKVKVLDFGLAKVDAGDGSETALSSSALMAPVASTLAGRDPRDGVLHAARTGTRPAGRQARGHLGVRRDAVRNAGRQASLRGRHAGGRSRRGLEGRT